ncbi:transcriptional regulator, TetR family [Frankineae bacterium MT45]|nr:transcriptional regulator, TetR family [Frankineae bacterium MT45]
MTSRAPRPTKPGPRPRLNRDLIVEAAFRVCARTGPNGLTFQAIGEELGAHPTAIYRYFADRDALMLALLDAMHRETNAELGDPTDDWVADLKAIARIGRAVMLRYPQVAQAVGARTTRQENEFRSVERILSCMRRAGFDDRDAARYYRAFSEAILGFATQEATLASLDMETRAADLRAWKYDYLALPEESYPNIHAAGPMIPAVDDETNFELALQMMIDALIARAPKAVPGPKVAKPKR